jgi:hypothetical protein
LALRISVKWVEITVEGSMMERPRNSASSRRAGSIQVAGRPKVGSVV